MRKTVAIVAGLLLLLTFAQCKKEKVEEKPSIPTDVELSFETVEAIVTDSVSAILHEVIVDNNLHDAMSIIARRLVQMEEVVTAEIFDDDIEITFTDGSTHLLMFRYRSDEEEISTRLDLRSLKETRDGSPSSLRGKKMLIWEPYCVELKPNFLGLAQELNQAELGLTVYTCQSNSCTFASLDTITHFDYIIMHTHGGRGGCFATHILVTEELNEEYADLISEGLVGRATVHHVDGVEQSDPPVYIVKSRYIDNLEERFHNCIVFAGFCHGMDNGGTDMSEAFHNKGAAVFCGFEGSVKTSYDKEIGTALTECLVYERMFSGEAYDKVHEEHPDRPVVDGAGNVTAPNRFRMTERSNRFVRLCEPIPDDPPVVVTHEVLSDNITSSTALVIGSVAFFGSSQPDYFERGFVYGTSLDGLEIGEALQSVYTGTDLLNFSCTLTGLASNTTYYFKAYSLWKNDEVIYGDVEYFTTLNTGGGSHEYVDLGLPSGLLWATCNVGANAPEEYGDYFAWGETQPKSDYSCSNYIFAEGETEYGNPIVIKYCNSSTCGYNGFVDNLTTLLPEDDAATANWGMDWRMPTKEEFEELFNNTTVTWTTQNSVDGCLFTASNGNNIFFPASGWIHGSNLDYEGIMGDYRSSSLYTGYPGYAWQLVVASNPGMDCYLGRQIGLPIRPVRATSQPVSYVVNAMPSPVEGGEIVVTGGSQSGTTCTLTATANEGYTFTNWTENGTVVSTNATYSFTLTGNRTLVANFTVTGGGGSHEYVDLGLPSGTLWATCNVGANAPEEYGDYFAWGETTPKSVYNWSTYQHCNGSNNTLTKYCTNTSYGYNGFTDNLITLLPEDDAASANWGADWRMPTWTEWQELYENTTNSWITQNGVNGRLFISANGNSLFLPAAGGRWGEYFNSEGSLGKYGSSSLYYYSDGGPWASDCAWTYDFDMNTYLPPLINDYSRYTGRSIRPVRSSR